MGGFRARGQLFGVIWALAVVGVGWVAPPVSRRATDPGARARDPGSMHACRILDPPYEIVPL
eukprot:SAG11_NODE_837_length_6925_cov_43.745532_8_plen_62_part_00